MLRMAHMGLGGEEGMEDTCHRFPSAGSRKDDLCKQPASPACLRPRSCNLGKQVGFLPLSLWYINQVIPVKIRAQLDWFRRAEVDLCDELDHESKGAELVIRDFPSPGQEQQAGMYERLIYSTVCPIFSFL